MLTDREVLSTLNMLRNEHLDVRTVTLGISLFDCASHDFDVFAYRVRAKIAKYAAKLVATCNEVGDKFGIPVVNKRISVSPIGVVGASFSRDQMVRACQVLDESAKDAGVDFLGGFGALVEKGITPGERNLIDALPEALATTDRICSSINVASTRSGINMDAVALLGQRILDVAEATRDRDGLGCAKLVVFANIPQDVPFMAGAYLGVGEPDVVINVGVSGPGVVKKAIDRAMENHKPGEFTLGEVAEVIKRTACRKLGLEFVCVHTAEDIHSGHVRIAKELGSRVLSGAFFMFLYQSWRVTQCCLLSAPSPAHCTCFPPGRFPGFHPYVSSLMPTVPACAPPPFPLRLHSYAVHFYHTVLVGEEYFVQPCFPSARFGVYCCPALSVPCNRTRSLPCL